ncbi:MAG TPA: histidine--tRNA ligase [Candidatus Eremiobacteraceae bacterium]|nr:histidine--tRNA ligase [Candidatus Eremiobacteraceae bacterium]
MKNLTAPRGTYDILPDDSRRWQALEAVIDGVCARYCYGEIRTPLFESTDVFVRTIGEGTDIVDKEMYTFIDRGGRSITLRPELTAPVVRAVLEHSMLQTLPLKLYYRGPFFRYERPQRGRFRQAHQVGVECFGTAAPEADAEVIALALDVVGGAGIRDRHLELNSIGCPTCRAVYRKALVEYFEKNSATLSELSRARLTTNPLRILDSKDEADLRLVATAPRVLDYLCAECRAHFEGVKSSLRSMHIDFAINPNIVRGLDYYTRTVFEITSPALGAQSAVAGGGRYDGLVESMGGPPTPGVGFGMGMDRLILAAHAEGSSNSDERQLDVAFVALETAGLAALVPALHAMRTAGFRADVDYTLRKMDKQLKNAAARGARLAVIVGSDELSAGEATIQNLDTRERSRVALAHVEGEVVRRLQQREKA